MSYTIALIGAGNMGGAIAKAVCRGIDPKQVVIADHNTGKTEEISRLSGCCVAPTAAEAARDAEIVFLCVKPQVFSAAVDEVRESLKGAKLVVSIAAGITLESLRALLGDEHKPLCRIMPNTPAAIGKGVLLTAFDRAPTELQDRLMELLAPCGAVEPVTEKELDFGSAISGCGPAFVYLFIEALADGGVQIGLSREKAQRYAAQTLVGAASMVLESGMHPGALKDAVCSPGGTTIAGVEALEKGAFRYTAASAVTAAYEKNQKIGK